VARVQASAKYRSVCERTIRRIAGDEWTGRGQLKRAIKATKSRLHQVHGAYESAVDYEQAHRSLQRAYTQGTEQEVRAACTRLLSLHASTRERLPVLALFYAQIYAQTGVPHTLLDLACGLNPLSTPWMGLGEGATYYAYDIDVERVAFLNSCLTLAGMTPGARLQDVICDPPTERGDVALLLKTSTCLERQRRGSTLALLDALQVPYAVVSYPVKSLGSREKGMPESYERAFREMVSGRPWAVTRLAFESELAFIVHKGPG
jgi:16S rRNA (guanine(1405)-N(7))-methyltransferase